MAGDDPRYRRQVERNRENQRNFRARRNQYVDDLERRVREYESKKVQATTAVQAASRRVDEENQKLKKLLETRFGMTRAEINKYLGIEPARFDVSRLGSLQPQQPPTMPQRSANSATATNTTNNTIPLSQPQAVTSAPPITATRVQANQEALPVTTNQTISTPVVQSCSTAVAKPCKHTHPGTTDAMSCEEAAQIIKSLRGQYEEDDNIWKELGCQDGKGCTVKNSTLFELMDK